MRAAETLVRVAVVTASLCASAGATVEAPTDAARAVLKAQQDAWNRGDLDAFMAGYWKNDDLRFAGGDQIRRGWQTTLDRYRKTYPDAAAMGKLDFDLVEVRALTPTVVYVFGKWQLARSGDATGHAPHGLFTLIVEKKVQGWVVTRDHTSSAE